MNFQCILSILSLGLSILEKNPKVTVKLQELNT